MDAFLTSAQRALRKSLRDYFQERAQGNPDGVFPDSLLLPGLGRLLTDLGYPDLLGSLPAEGQAGLLDRALIIEEISAASPELGQTLLPGAGGPDALPGSAAGEAAGEAAWTIGAAAAVLVSCLRAAREKGLFESTLMDYQKVQSELAGALSGLEAARLQTYRALLLLDRGDVDRGREELGRATACARTILGGALTLAASLGVGIRLPGTIPGQERNQK
jgi:alkylation response protein AidB-like acyl-CoA dehydrogenase